MESETYTPPTLLEAIRHFSDLDVATQYVASIRWPEGFVCPACDGKKHSYLKTRRLWKCSKCKKQTSVKKGTIFEDSPLGLDKWLAALWLLVNCKNGISSYEVARDVGISQKAGWFVLQRLRLAMQEGSIEKYADKFDGVVEIDETYIGGKARNRHVHRRTKGQGPFQGKVGVMGFLERGGNVRLTIVPTTKRPVLQKEVRRRVRPGAEVVSDDLRSYRGLDAHYTHKVIDHAEKYVDGLIHTNGLENFWSLLKRGLGGTYVIGAALPPLSLPGRAGLPLQQPQGVGRGSLRWRLEPDGWASRDVGRLTDKTPEPALPEPRPVARWPLGPF